MENIPIWIYREHHNRVAFNNAQPVHDRAVDPLWDQSDPEFDDGEQEDDDGLGE